MAAVISTGPILLDSPMDIRTPHRKVLRSLVFTAIHARPQTCKEVADAWGLTQLTVRDRIAELLDLDLIHVSGRMEKGTTTRRNLWVYAAGGAA